MKPSRFIETEPPPKFQTVEDAKRWQRHRDEARLAERRLLDAERPAPTV